MGIRFIAIVMSLILWCPSIHAVTFIRKKEINFTIDPESIMKTGTQYSWRMMEADKFKQNFSHFLNLDGMRVLKNHKGPVVISKTVFTIEKSANYFTPEQISDEAFLRYLYPAFRVKKIEENMALFQSQDRKFSFENSFYVDADTMTSIRNPRYFQPFILVRKLDPLSMGAFTATLQTLEHFSDHAVGGNIVTFYIPIKANKTLVLTYQLLALKNQGQNKKSLHDQFVREAATYIHRLNQY